MRRILGGFISNKVDEPCIEPKQKQSRVPLLESPLKAHIMDMDALVGHSSFGPTNHEIKVDEWTSTVATRILGDSHQKKIEHLKESLLAMKEKIKVLNGTIV